MDFSIGPFSFTAGRALRVAGTPSRRWALSYGSQQLGERTVPETATPRDVREAFSNDIGAFTAELRSRHIGGLVYLHNAVTGEDVASFAAKDAWIPGMSAGLPDDRWAWWLVSSSRPKQSMHLDSLAEFAHLVAEYEMPANGWIAGLLPEEVLTTDRDEWRAPSPWEIRHVVGEASFTGVTGVMAAGGVGVTPQNFRKYLAPEGAATHQSMSFAMWHMLLHRLGVKTLPPYYDCAQAASEIVSDIFPSLPQGS